MRPAEPSPAPATDPLAAVVAELRAIRELLDRDGGQLLLTNDEAADLCGVSRSGWYRLVSAGQAPKPVEVPGVGPRFRRADLVKWCEKLATRRRRPKAVPSEPAGE